MIDLSPAALWTVILVLGAGTYLIRLSFLAFAGGRAPDWAARLLRYVPVTVLPALVAPLVVWPEGAEAGTDPVRLAAALGTVAIGAVTRSLFGAVAAGFALLFGLPALI